MFSSGEAQTAALPRLLEEVTSRDRGASGLFGTVSIGVLSEEGETWWNARVDGALSTRIDAQPAEDANALVMLGVAEAQSIVENGALPEIPRLASIEGDRLLVADLVARYFSRQSAIALRGTFPARPSPPRSRR
ncbi:MAG: hypothetical protein U1E65_15695 [Myxococcota bacterium]